MKSKGISSTGLKGIAALIMLTDHIAFVVLSRMAFMMGGNENLAMISRIMRGVGRLAFPLFCFLLVEGFERTGNRLKYIGRVGLVALLSEIPFDLACSMQPIYWEYQNTMFTLFVGLVVMYGVDYFMTSNLASTLRYSGMVLLIIGGMYLTDYFSMDYGSKGVFCIMVLYLLRHRRSLQAIGGALSFIWELYAPLAFLLVLLYNGEKGRGKKGFFYTFYPLHLLVLYLVCKGLGIG